MTDLEITRLCAQAMGLKVSEANYHDSKGKPLFCPVVADARTWTSMGLRNVVDVQDFNPLIDDAQAMALAKKFKMNIHFDGSDNGYVASIWPAYSFNHESARNEMPNLDLNRSICECVAGMVRSSTRAHKA